LCGFAALVSGCGSGRAEGEGGVTVRGRLLDNGAPLKPLPDEQIRISFVDANGGAVASTADYDANTGTFEITGPSGKGIPAGEYRVELVSEIYGGDGVNRFEEQFDAEKTPLRATVGVEQGQEFVVDIKKKTVTHK
jgi:hypothetical protein